MTEARGIDIDLLPELPSAPGLAGGMREEGAGGQPCSETGVLVALLVFSLSEQ